MNNIHINSITSNSLLSIPIFFMTMLGNAEEASESHINFVKYETKVTDIFQELPQQNVVDEQNEMNILMSFVSEIINDSKDLDGEIVDMVNRKFEKLLLKI